MNTSTKTIILLICLTMTYCLENNLKKTQGNLKASPSEIVNSPRLIQEKLKEKIAQDEEAVSEKAPKKSQEAPKKKSDKLKKSDKESDKSTESNKTDTVKIKQSTGKKPTASKRTTDSAVTPAATTPVDPNDKFYFTRNIQCDNKNCPAPYAVCSDNNTCRCLPGYANFIAEGQATPGYYCNYEQKKQLVAFLLEMFVSMGVGHFYTGRVLMGIIKLLVLLGPVMFGILMCCSSIIKSSSDTSSCAGLFFMVGSCACVCAALVWQLVDLIMFGINNYKDGNGVPLAHW
jgi:hypothetical protein